MGEDEEEDLGYEAEEEEEEAPDPLADLDEDTRTNVDALIEARAKALADEQTNTLRGSLGKWGQAKKELDALGIVVDDSGHVGAHDPAKFAEAAKRFAGTPEQEQQKQEEDLTINVWDEPGEIDRKVSLRVARATEAAMKPVLDQMQALTGFLGQQSLPTVAAQAKPFLEIIGLGHVADSPEFSQGMAHALKDVPLAGRQDPATIRAAAGMVLGSLPDNVLQPQNGGQRTERRQAQDLVTLGHRASLASASASRGRAAVDDSHLTDDEKGALAFLRESGVEGDPRGFLAAASAPDDRTGRSAYNEYLSRAKKGR